ncbi:MAG: DMT family transporter [Gammaproteobacteria bacterium]|nr:DMT family transporter [Gammaproteobacteria bacterium]
MTERAAHLRGVILMIAAVGVFAVMDAMMKHLTARYPPLQMGCLRGAASLPFVLLATWLTGSLRRLRPVRWPLYLARAALGVFMFWTFLYALSRASMTETYAVFMSAPLLVVLCATFLLGERPARHVWVAILVGLAGVLVMLRPDASGFVSLASLAAFASALAYAIVVVMVRIMARTESTPAMVFWYLLVLAIGAGLLAAPGWVRILPGDWLWIAAIGFLGWAGQHLVTDAFRLAPASTVAPYEYMALVWAAAIDWIIWQTLPGARMLTGAAIVIGAGIFLMHRQRARP